MFGFVNLANALPALPSAHAPCPVAVNSRRGPELLATLDARLLACAATLDDHVSVQDWLSADTRFGDYNAQRPAVHIMDFEGGGRLYLGGVEAAECVPPRRARGGRLRLSGQWATGLRSHVRASVSAGGRWASLRAPCG